MRISDSLVEKLLDRRGKVSKKQISALKHLEDTEKKPLRYLVLESKILNEKQLLVLRHRNRCCEQRYDQNTTRWSS